MVYTIAPAVRRSPGLRSWALVSATYALGSVLGGAITGFAVGLTGSALSIFHLSSQLTRVAFGLLAGASVIRDVRFPMSTLPALHRQVPERWRGSLPLPIATFLYGFQLGLGWATHAYFATYYVLLGFVLMTGNAASGAFLVALYGFGRASVVLMFPPESEDLDHRLERMGAR